MERAWFEPLTFGSNSKHYCAFISTLSQLLKHKEYIKIIISERTFLLKLNAPLKSDLTRFIPASLPKGPGLERTSVNLLTTFRFFQENTALSLYDSGMKFMRLSLSQRFPVHVTTAILLAFSRSCMKDRNVSVAECSFMSMFSLVIYPRRLGIKSKRNLHTFFNKSKIDFLKIVRQLKD